MGVRSSGVAWRITVAGLVGVLAGGVLAEVAPWGSGLVALLATVAVLPSAYGVHLLGGRAILVVGTVLLGVLGSIAVRDVVPAFALTNVGESVTCEVTGRGRAGLIPGAHDTYALACPDGTPEELAAVATTWEVDRRYGIGGTVDVVRDPFGLLRPDLFDSHRALVTSWWRLLALFGLPGLVLWVLGRAQPPPASRRADQGLP